jgi:hypothetical protein
VDGLAPPPPSAGEGRQQVGANTAFDFHGIA